MSGRLVWRESAHGLRAMRRSTETLVGSPPDLYGDDVRAPGVPARS
ncbi:hypothetical protein [Streptomyces sp. NPDC093589]